MLRIGIFQRALPLQLALRLRPLLVASSSPLPDPHINPPPVPRRENSTKTAAAVAAVASSAQPLGRPPAVIVYVTVPNRDVGRTIGRTVVEEKLAACTNIVPGLESIYFWGGKVTTDEELLLMIKTRAALVEELTARVQKLHPYVECEVVAVPIVGGSQSYLNWVIESTKGGE